MTSFWFDVSFNLISPISVFHSSRLSFHSSFIADSSLRFYLPPSHPISFTAFRSPSLSLFLRPFFSSFLPACVSPQHHVTGAPVFAFTNTVTACLPHPSLSTLDQAHRNTGRERESGWSSLRVEIFACCCFRSDMCMSVC